LYIIKKKKGNKIGKQPIHKYTKEKKKTKETKGLKQQNKKPENISQKF
jgi:hypothetical protein